MRAVLRAGSLSTWSMRCVVVRRLGGWNELDNVAEKRTKLRDYLPAAELKSLTTEIKNISNSIPIRNVALPEGEPSL